ncbi:MAG: hypothetical protein P4M15_04805 [Alphaproteobacteria bacterium]|nr:hypothetical protein [Alphaproteobacteria bacterium]
MATIGGFIGGTFSLAFLCGLGYGVYQNIEGQPDAVAAFKITVADTRSLGASLHAGRGVSEVVDVFAIAYGAAAGAGALVSDGAIDLGEAGWQALRHSNGEVRQSRLTEPQRRTEILMGSVRYAPTPAPV